MITYAQVRVRSSVNELASYSYSSNLTEGRVLCTSGSKQFLEYPPEWNVEPMPGSSVGEVFERHQVRLAVCENSEILPSDASRVMDTLRQIENRAFEFQLWRGVYRLASAREREPLIRLRQHYASGSLQHASWPTNEALSTVVFLVAFFSGSLLGLRDALPQNFTQALVLGAIMMAILLCVMVFIWRKRLF